MSALNSSPDQPPLLSLLLHVLMLICSPFSLTHTQMGVSFPATFSSHFNSKAKLGRRAASHSQFRLGEKKGDSLDLPGKGESWVWGGEWWQTYPYPKG